MQTQSPVAWEEDDWLMNGSNHPPLKMNWALTSTELQQLSLCRVGQNHIYTVYIQNFWQGNHQIHSHIRCIYTVLANPIFVTLACAPGKCCFVCLYFIHRVGQNRIYTPYMAVYLFFFLQKIPYLHRICMAMANPIHSACDGSLWKCGRLSEEQHTS
jgi:hypothetical protein